jgi:hypothetical protein
MERSSGAGRVTVDRDQPVGSSARHVEAAADIAATRSREPADRVTRSGEADRRHDDRTPEPSEKARLIVANPTHRATRTGRRRNAVNLRRWGRGRRRGQRKNRQLAANGRRRHVSTEPRSSTGSSSAASSRPASSSLAPPSPPASSSLAPPSPPASSSLAPPSPPASYPRAPRRSPDPNPRPCMHPPSKSQAPPSPPAYRAAAGIGKPPRRHRRQ